MTCSWTAGFAKATVGRKITSMNVEKKQPQTEEIIHLDMWDIAFKC